MFEATTDQAVDFFCDLETTLWTCRLAIVCADVHAIFTPELSLEFIDITATVSQIFGVACYQIVCDEPDMTIWKDGEVWISKAPRDHQGLRFSKQVEATVFLNSSAQSDGQLWQQLHNFAWSNFCDKDFLLEE